MSSEVKYIGMDVHKEAIVIAVRDTRGHVVMESIVETKASSILQFIRGLQGELHVTWEEGTWAAWLYDLLKPHVHRVLVCNPRRNALLKEGSMIFGQRCSLRLMLLDWLRNEIPDENRRLRSLRNWPTPSIGEIAIFRQLLTILLSAR
jgi:hypothetical protein